MSGLLHLCTELTLFCTELPENCIYPNQSELSDFFIFIINDRGVKRFTTLMTLRLTFFHIGPIQVNFWRREPHMSEIH